MKHSKSIRVAMAALCVAAMAACSMPESNSSTAEEGGQGQGESGEGGADILRVATPNIVDSLGNPFKLLGSPGSFTATPVFDALTRLDASGEAQPHLAVSWEPVDAQEETWRFTLREDVEFSNGEVFDAEAVAATINWLATDETGRTQLAATNLIPTVESAEVVEPFVVDIASDGSNPDLPNQLAGLFIVPPKYFAEVGVDEFATAPIGTGAFTVTSWEPSGVTYERWSDSWRSADLGGIEIQRISDPTARTQAIRSGQVHVSLNMPPSQLETLENDGIDVVVSPAAIVAGYAFVTTKGDSPVNDVRVRQAINYAVDKEAIAEQVFRGTAEPWGQSASESTLGYNEDIEPYPYDPERARELLADAGYADGFQLTLEVIATREENTLSAQLVASDLQAVGIDASVDALAYADWDTKLYSNGWEGEMFQFGWYNTPTMTATRPYPNYSCEKADAYYCDEELDEYITAARTTVGEEHQAAVSELLSYAHESAVTLFTVRESETAAHQGIDGFDLLNSTVDYDVVTVD